MSNTEKIAISKIANWWAEQVSSPAANWNNGDDSMTGGAAFLLGNLLAAKSREKITAESIAAFIKELEQTLETGLETSGHIPSLYVDYRPDGNLSVAAERAGVPLDAFPCKSSTSVRGGVAYGRVGYGKPELEIA